jgi:CP family cyanate transporter-like MFS transporter
MMQQEESYRMPRGILASAWLLAFAMYAPMFSVPPMAHILKEELLLTHMQTSLLFTAPVIMVVALAIPAGIISDRIGVKKATGIGVILLAVGAMLRGTADSTSSLLIFTFIYGAGLGWCYPNLAKLISGWVPPQRAGMAMGILTTGMMAGCGLALAITMSVIFPITNTFQGVFFIWGIIPIAAAIMWWIVVKQPPHSEIQAQSARTDNIPFRRTLRDKNIWLVSALFFLSSVFFWTWSGWAPTLLMLKQATPEMAGLLTSVTLWVGIPTGLLMPRLAYKLGLRKPFLWIPAIALAAAALGARTITLDMSWIIMVVVGVALITQFPTILALPVEMVPKEQVGAASGLVLSVGFAGGVIGPLIGGRILDITDSLSLSLVVLAGVSVAMVGVAFMLPETGYAKKRLRE